MWASRPSARSSMLARTASSIRLSARPAGGVDTASATAKTTMAAGGVRGGQRQHPEPRAQSERAEGERDCARADRRNEEEGGAQRADDRACGRDAVDGARYPTGALRRAQEQPDGEGRIHAEKSHREEHERERGEQAAGANVVDAGEHEFENGLGEALQRQEIERPDDDGEG